MTAAAKDGWALYYASTELQADRDVVMTALANDVKALEFASDELKADREFILGAIGNKGSPALKYASIELRNTPLLVKFAKMDRKDRLVFLMRVSTYAIIFKQKLQRLQEQREIADFEKDWAMATNDHIIENQHKGLFRIAWEAIHKKRKCK